MRDSRVYEYGTRARGFGRRATVREGYDSRVSCGTHPVAGDLFLRHEEPPHDEVP